MSDGVQKHFSSGCDTRSGDRRGRPRGRPRAFVEEEALDRAIAVFRQHGYDGTTMEALAAAMGLNKPSLYRAFGDREALYHRAVERYGALVRADWGAAVCGCLNLSEGIDAFLAAALRWFAPEGGASAGCLVLSTMPAAAADQRIRDGLHGFVGDMDAELARLLEDRFLTGRPAASEEATRLAMLLSAGVHSMALRARSGAAEAELRALADIVARSAMGLVGGEPAGRAATCSTAAGMATSSPGTAAGAP